MLKEFIKNFKTAFFFKAYVKYSFYFIFSSRNNAFQLAYFSYDDPAGLDGEKSKFTMTENR